MTFRSLLFDAQEALLSETEDWQTIVDNLFAKASSEEEKTQAAEVELEFCKLHRRLEEKKSAEIIRFPDGAK